MNLTLPKAIPAGTYFAFIKSDERDIFVMGEADGFPGRNVDRILVGDGDRTLQEFEFSPDGKRLFCTLKGPKGLSDDVSLLVIDQIGRVKRFDGFTSVFASWLKDGSNLLVRSHSGAGDRTAIWLADVDRGDRLDVEKPGDLFLIHGIYDPEFLVSFKKHSFNERSVYGVREDGEEIELFREKHEIRELKFSPDRKKIAYFYSYPYYKWILGWRIGLLDVDTLVKTIVFDGVAESIFRLRWSPDSKCISFICGTSGIPNNRLMDMDRYETMGNYAPDLMSNTYIAFSMRIDGSARREIVRDSWKFEWMKITDFMVTDLKG